MACYCINLYPTGFSFFTSVTDMLSVGSSAPKFFKHWHIIQTRLYYLSVFLDLFFVLLSRCCLDEWFTATATCIRRYHRRLLQRCEDFNVVYHSALHHPYYLRVTFQLTVSQSVSQSVLVSSPILRSWPDVCFCLTVAVLSFWREPSLTRRRVCRLSESLSAVVSHLSKYTRYIHFTC
jgi:hypothetical protein